MVRWVFWLLFGMIRVVEAQSSTPFYSLSHPLEHDAHQLRQLNERFLVPHEPQLVANYCNDVETTVQLGEKLAKKSPKEEKLFAYYLEELRSLASRQEAIFQLYRESLIAAIKTNDKPKFHHLASIELEPLHQPRIRSEAIAFYQKNFPKNSIQTLDALCKEQLLETKSIHFIEEQEQAYEEHLRTLKRSDIAKIKQTAKIGSQKSVLVSEATMPNGDIVFEAENLNPYVVTLSLDFETLTNLTPNQTLPLHIELLGRSKKELVRLHPLHAGQPTAQKSTYGWVRGSAFVRHDDTYIYRLPFASGMSVRVGQGYNGGLSHKGLSAYAIDFSVPIGTPIYAAREGEVVGVDVSNNRGGASPAYRPYMNYVTIKHSDGTLGNYYHLKQGGSAVRIGERVKKGQLIAYSGNTGYTTAPHLHFSVSMVDPISMRRPKNLPIVIQSKEGLITCPTQGDRYTPL